jgi:hypothetical protein
MEAFGRPRMSHPDTQRDSGVDSGWVSEDPDQTRPDPYLQPVGGLGIAGLLSRLGLAHPLGFALGEDLLSGAVEMVVIVEQPTLFAVEFCTFPQSGRY